MAKKQKSDAPPVQEHAHPTESGFETVLEEHGKKIIVVVLLLLIAACSWFVVSSLAKQKAVEAAKAFTAAETRSELEAVIKNYPASTAAGNALLMLADRLQSGGDDDALKDAEEKLAQFVDEFAKHPRYLQGVLNLGMVREALGKTDEAAERYEEVAGAGDDSELAPLARMRQSELAVAAGDLERANEILSGIAADFPGTPFFDIIEARIKNIEQKIVLAENPPPEPEPEPEGQPEEAKKPADAPQTEDASKPAAATTPDGTTPSTPPTPPEEETSPEAPASPPTENENAPAEDAPSEPASDNAAAESAPEETVPNPGESGDAPDS